MKRMSCLAAALTRRWRGRREGTDEIPDRVYRCTVVEEPSRFLVLEIRWHEIAHFLKSRTEFHGLSNELIKVKLDSSQIEGPLEILFNNPSLRIRKRRMMQVVPSRLIPVPDSEIYFLQVRKLTLAHVERQFKFNFVTWRLANTIPLWVGAGMFAAWGISDGWELHQSDDFFAAIAGITGLTALAFAIWRLTVQESDKRFDSLCRRLEHELMSDSLNTLSTIMRGAVASPREHVGSQPNSPPPRSPPTAPL